MRLKRIGLLLLVLSVSATFCLASELSGAGVTVGVTVDVAPFGVDQLFLSLQGFYYLPGTVSLGVKPSVGFNDGAVMVRVPIVVNQRYRLSEDSSAFFSLFVGGGIEYYASSGVREVSPYFTGGVSGGIGRFFLDVPVSSALREKGSDTDFGVTAGVLIEF